MPRPPRARSSPCGAPTAPARRRPWRSSRATERPTAAWCACSASTHGATRAGCARGAASCSNAPSCTARYPAAGGATTAAGRRVGLGPPAELRAPPAGREGATHRSVRLELIGPLSETDAAALGRLGHVGGGGGPRGGRERLRPRPPPAPAGGG